jgi:hypothetical protein
MAGCGVAGDEGAGDERVMSSKKFIFPDTNVFEQFQPIENIDWLGLTGADEATLMIAPVVISELNKHKDTSDRARLRNRAAAGLKRFHQVLDGGTADIRSKVNLQFCASEPCVNFRDYRLDPTISDDRLIASAVDFAIANGLDGEDVLIATGDFGLRLKVSSQPSTRALILPANLRLDEEEDFETKKIRELEKEITKLRAMVPELKITFSDGTVFQKFKIHPPLELNSAKVDEHLAKLKATHPVLKEDNFLSFQESAIPFFLPNIPKYNRDLEAFYANTKSFLHLAHEHFNKSRRSICLELKISNCGTAPATDVDIRLHFPDGFTLTQETPHVPKRPKPPDSPEEALKKKLSFSLGDMPGIYGPPEHMPQFSNLTLTKLKKGNSYDVEFHVLKLKHTNSEPLKALYLAFDGYERAKPFRIEYQALASNMRAPVSGTLDVLVEK